MVRRSASANTTPAEIGFVNADGGSRSGADLYQRFAELLDKQVSKAVLGQSGTADMTGLSEHTQPRVPDGVRGDLTEVDGKQLARIIPAMCSSPTSGSTTAPTPTCRCSSWSLPRAMTSGRSPRRQRR